MLTWTGFWKKLICQMASKTKIAVYSGSFNPFHCGHLAIVRYLLEHQGYEKVIIVVSPQNPFKDPHIAESARKRLDTVRDAIARNALENKVTVDDIEFHLPAPSYTIHTLDELQRRNPDSKFTLVIGADNLPGIMAWDEGERILTQYGIAVYPREGFNMVHDSAVLRRKHKNSERIFGAPKHKPLHIKLMCDAVMVNVSSTLIREKETAGEDYSELIP